MASAATSVRRMCASASPIASSLESETPAVTRFVAARSISARVSSRERLGSLCLVGRAVATLAQKVKPSPAVRGQM